MCGLLETAITLGVLSIGAGAAGAVASHQGQKQAATAQNQYQAALAQARNTQIQNNNLLAQQAYNQKSAQENLKVQVDEAKDVQDSTKNRVLAAQAKARVRTAAGEAGVSGLSLDALLADYDRQQQAFDDSVSQNQELRRLQSGFNRQGYYSEAQSRVSSLSPYIPSRVEGPSFIGTALQIGKDVFGGGAQMALNMRT